MKQRDIPKPGEFYRHFKIKYYQIITIALHSETREQMVVYQALYDNFGVYVRPLEMFLSKVDREKYPDAVQTYRFERVDSPCVSVESLERVIRREEETEETTGIEQQTEEENKEVVGTAGNDDIKEAEAVIANVQQESVESTEKFVLDPEVERFLDADTYKDKLNILVSLRNHITDKQLHDMAVTLDVTIEDGDLDDKFMNLVKCLKTMARFEINR